MVGERALLERGPRTATLRVVTDCVIATTAQDQIDRASLASLAEMHHRENPDRLPSATLRTRCLKRRKSQARPHGQIRPRYALLLCLAVR
jgi:CRP-like cAMP-binding protein